MKNGDFLLYGVLDTNLKQKNNKEEARSNEGDSLHKIYRWLFNFWII